MEEEQLHPFQALCPYISPRAEGENCAGGVAWEGRGGNLSGRQQGKGIGLECWCKGGGRDLGMKYAVRIHLLRVALEVLCQFQRDALHLLSPRTGSTCCPQGQAALISSLQPACAGTGSWEQQGCPLALGIPCGHKQALWRWGQGG